MVTALLSFCIPAAAQEEPDANMCFSVKDTTITPVRVYIDQNYIGDVMGEGEKALYVYMDYSEHTIQTVNRYGELYSGWPSTISPREGKVTLYKMDANKFKPYQRADNIEQDPLFWLWLGWDPIIRPAPIYPFPIGGGSYASDGDVIAMAIGTAAALGAMGAGAISNWNVPDNRFPNFSVGYSFLWLGSAELMRNTVEMKYRFGGLGGMSVFADAGIENSFPDRIIYPTFSAGFSFDYGGFALGLRYKPSVSSMRTSFALLQANYDFIIGEHFAIGFNAGVGLSGYGMRFAQTRIESALGFGLKFRF